MALSVLNNIASLAAQNQLTITNSNLQKSLFQLSSGSRINTGADDAAGLAIADGLHANITALTQSPRSLTALSRWPPKPQPARCPMRNVPLWTLSLPL